MSHQFLRISVVAAIIILVSFRCTLAQGIFQLSADLRARGEYRHGFGFPLNQNQHAGFFVDQRSRLNFDYSQSKLVLRVSVQDIRVWGNTPQLVRTDGGFTALHEGWGQVFFTDEFSLKVGRQEINLDDQRIFGAVDWLMQARSHDAAMLKYKGKDVEVQAAFAYNQDGVQNTTTYYTVQNNYKALQYLWAHQKFGKFNGSFLFLNNGRQGGTPDAYKTYFTQTVGPRIGYVGDPIRAYLTYYGQFGDEPDGNTDVNAHYVALEVGFKVNENWTITPGTEYLSGNDWTSTPSGTNRAFNPFYGTNHKFNGLMDYFYVMGQHINSVGLHDIYLMGDYRNQRFSGSGRVHYFRAAGEVGNLFEPQYKQRLGIEADVVLQYRFSDQVTFDAGISRFFPTESLIRVKGTGDTDVSQYWGWLMVSFRPILYKTPPPAVPE